MKNKIKSHSGAKKRFKFTGTGKIKYKKSGQRHLLTGDAPHVGRKAHNLQVLDGVEARKIARKLPYR
jgi:large subunit ribosomal protein L35